jgi:hypothetical protein
VLGGAQQDDLPTDAHEVQRAVGAEREAGDRLEAGARGGRLLGLLDLLQEPVQAVDEAQDEREAEDHANEAPARGALGGLSGSSVILRQVQ